MGAVCCHGEGVLLLRLAIANYRREEYNPVVRLAFANRCLALAYS